ncbi:porin PorA family protein [Streptomyces sp. NPDC058751]|uniref:porin PorA family protein n=1 Tax=Streptomyces sp. NPDC058751 TaxID=3346623 RepID=UPI00368E5036
MRRSSWILTGSAVALVAASAVMRFSVCPALHQIPSDADGTFHYKGTASLLNAPALAAGDRAHAFLRDLPVTLDRRITVKDTSGRTAVVLDSAVLRGPDGKPLNAAKHVWAVDRRTLVDRPAPAGSGAEKHTGLVFSWPLDPEKRDYRFWDSGIRKTVPARYTGQETVNGRDAYRYDIEATGPLADPATVEALPKVLPRSAVAALTAVLPAARRPDEAVLADLPEAVPLTYVSTTVRTGWVDANTGLSLNGVLRQTVLARTQGAGGPVTLFPVTDVAVKGTAASVREQAHDASTAQRVWWWLSTGVPLGLLVLAALPAGLAVRSARRPAADRGTAGDEHEGTPAA